MIGVDWGTSSLRAYRLDPAGGVLDRIEAPRGILAIAPGGFADELRAQIGGWLAAGEREVLLCGMIGSRQGWVEAPYLTCPADAAGIASAVVAVPFESGAVRLVPGLADSDDADTPEVMRGEETQLVGVMQQAGEGLACLPGSHSKWARIGGGRINGFRTYLSGEAFSALRGGTILGRMMHDGPTSLPAFDRGVARAEDPGHLLHHLFGVRSLGLFGRLADADSASYLSGLLIGHEVFAAKPSGQTVTLIGAEPLCTLYARAITAAGGVPVLAAPDAAARGLAAIARSVSWH